MASELKTRLLVGALGLLAGVVATYLGIKAMDITSMPSAGGGDSPIVVADGGSGGPFGDGGRSARGAAVTITHASGWTPSADGKTYTASFSWLNKIGLSRWTIADPDYERNPSPVFSTPPGSSVAIVASAGTFSVTGCSQLNPKKLVCPVAFDDIQIPRQDASGSGRATSRKPILYDANSKVKSYLLFLDVF